MILIAVREDRKRTRAVTIGGPKLGNVLKTGRGKGSVALAFFKLK